MTCSVRQQLVPQRPAAVSVDGTVIAREAIAREIQNHPSASPVQAWKQAAQALIIRELLLQQARRLNLAAAPRSDKTGRRETEEEALIRAAAESGVRVPEPDEASCRRYYEQNLRRFRSPDIYEASHILIAARQDDAEGYATARRNAETILSELRHKPQNFAALAKAHSGCPSASQGGNLGQLSAGQTTPEFERALARMQPDTLCDEPVATRYGFHIVRLDRKIGGRQLPFDFVRDRIASYLSERARRTATAQYIARLVSGAQIEGVELAGAEAHRVF